MDDKERIALNLCSVNEDALEKSCDFEVVIRKWEHSQEFINKGCFSVNKLRSYHLHPAEKNNKPQNTPIIDTAAENVFKISQHIKPKDFGAWNLFTGYINRYNKTYETKEEILRRFHVYKRNIRAAKMYQKSELGSAVYGETQFMDLTPSEFKRIMLPYVWEKPKNPIRQMSPDEIEDEPFPNSFDWRNKSVVTEVKNQGACGSCWAFSVTGNIEGQWAKKTGKLVSLSEQEILDCDGVDQACNGGMPMEAYKQIINMGGLESEAEYPYKREKDACSLIKKDVVAYINDSVQLPADEEKIAAYLFKNGPISVVVFQQKIYTTKYDGITPSDKN
uniref:Pept_C1 domain-containing protein n=1 Tax=Panagrellus redivivus TaxID=6233 RepID=A0A7E4UN97_PANRE